MAGRKKYCFRKNIPAANPDSTHQFGTFLSFQSKNAPIPKKNIKKTRKIIVSAIEIPPFPYALRNILLYILLVESYARCGQILKRYFRN